MCACNIRICNQTVIYRNHVNLNVNLNEDKCFWKMHYLTIRFPYGKSYCKPETFTTLSFCKLLRPIKEAIFKAWNICELQKLNIVYMWFNQFAAWNFCESEPSAKLVRKHFMNTKVSAFTVGDCCEYTLMYILKQSISQAVLIIFPVYLSTPQSGFGAI